MLYETAIRLDDGNVHRLFYDTETEWLWFADSGRPYMYLADEKRQPVKVRVPESIRKLARRT